MKPACTYPESVHKKLAGCLFFVLMGQSIALKIAADDALDDSPTYLDSIVVTATRTPRTVSDAPIRTEVVTQDAMTESHDLTVKEALEHSPGVLLREIHGKAGTEVWMQGLNADRVLILLDGLPVSAGTGSSVDVSQLSTLDIDRIEIVKGAVSAQYGSSAMGGVVNIISRPVEQGISGQATLDGGSYGDQNPSGETIDLARQNGQGSIDLGGDHWRTRLSMARQSSDGIDPEPGTWTRPGDRVDRTHVGQRIEWLPSASAHFNAELQYFREEGSSRYVLARPGNVINAGKQETVERLRGSVGGDHFTYSGLELHWNLLHEVLDNDTDKYTASSRFDQRSAAQTLSQASVWSEFQLTSAQAIQVGLDLGRATLKQQKDGISELLDGDVSHQSEALWLQDTWYASNRLEIVAGLRVQDDSDFGSHVAPKLNARYELLDTDDVDLYLRGGYGSGYRVPNLKERHYLFDHSQLGYIVLGSPELRPEESDNYQLGWGVSYRNIAWFEMNGFRNDIDKLIQTEVATAETAARGDGIQVFRYGNVDRARTQGIETTAGWQLATDWTLSVGYTYLHAEDLETEQRLTRRPRHQADLSLKGTAYLPGLTWLAQVRSQSSEAIDPELDINSPGFTTLDAKINQRWGDHIKLFAGVDNITDEQRDFGDVNDFGPVSGRFVYLGLTMDFSQQD